MAKREKETALAKWDEELAKAAKEATAAVAGIGGGNFFSLRGGVLRFNGVALPGNQVIGIIAHSMRTNVYYEGKFDPDQTGGPVCWAIGSDDATIAPHETSTKKQAEKCSLCPRNAWGSAADGRRGKACQNTIFLAILPAGVTDESGAFEPILEPEHLQTATPGYMKLPVTSCKGYAAFVRQLAELKKVPPFAVYTRIKPVPDPKTQFQVTFTAVNTVPSKLLSTVRSRNLALQEDFGLVLTSAAAEAPAPTPKKSAKKRF